jgi:hypothetical protein
LSCCASAPSRRAIPMAAHASLHPVDIRFPKTRSV